MQNQQTRIALGDSLQTIILNMSDGNPGAIMAIAAMVKTDLVVDTDSFFPGFGPLLTLDSHGCYGVNIYTLHHDVCREDTTLALAVLRATQLGVLGCDLKGELEKASETRSCAINPVKALQAVRAVLPTFAPDYTLPTSAVGPDRGVQMRRSASYSL